MPQEVVDERQRERSQRERENESSDERDERMRRTREQYRDMGLEDCMPHDVS